MLYCEKLLAANILFIFYAFILAIVVIALINYLRNGN